MPTRLRLRLGSYSTAVGAIALTVLLKFWLEQWIVLESPLLLFFPAIVLSTWWGGRRSGWLATMLAASLSYYSLINSAPPVTVETQTAVSDALLSVEPYFSWQLDSSQMLQLVLFLVAGGLISHSDRPKVQPEANYANYLVPFSPQQSSRPSEPKPNDSTSPQKTQQAPQQDTQYQAEQTKLLFLVETLLTTEAALRESEARSRAMFNQVAVGIAQVSLEGKFIQVNPALCDISGYSLEELQQMDIRDITHPDDIEADLGNAGRVLRREINSYTLEKRFIRKDGSILWINLTSSIVCDEDDRPKYAVGIIEDISDRKQAEANNWFLVEASTLLAASLNYETTLTNVAHLAVPTLADYCIVDIFQPDADWKQLAIASLDPQKQDLIEALRRRYPPEKLALLAPLRNGELIFEPVLTEERLRAIAQDAEHAHFLSNLNLKSLMVLPLVAHDQVFGSISFLAADSGRSYSPADLSLAKDVARRAASAIDNARLYQQAQEASRLKDEFLAIISHELRTPLNAILGWAQLIQTQKLKPALVEQAIEIIERNARAQTQLIKDLLDVSNIITGRFQLTPAVTDLTALVQQAVETVQLAAEAKSLQLTVELDPSPVQIWADATYLQQAIWNLLVNAIKFTPREGQIRVQMCQYPEDVQIRVSDTGQGIPPHFLPYVFERFRQADGTTTRTFGGLGLGLAIVRHVVELHGGTVEAFSAGEGQGATFSITVPIVPDSALHKSEARMGSSSMA